jgi:hypothetical protein
VIAAILIAAFALGVAWRLTHPVDPAKRTAELDKRHSRMLPATFEQVCEIDVLAYRAAELTGRHRDHVLAQYGAFTYKGGGRTMNRKRLKYVEAESILAALRRDFGVDDKPRRPEPAQNPYHEGPREGEESF